MAFVGKTDERLIRTELKTFKMFLTEQVGNYWVATVLFAIDGKVETENITGMSKKEVYEKAKSWVLENISENAEIEALELGINNG